MPNLVSFVHPSILIRLTLFGQEPRAVYIHIICSYKSFMHHMSSHLIWRIPNNQVSGAFMPPMLARSPDDSSEKPAALPVPDLTLSSPAIDAACPDAPSATSSAVTDGDTVAQRLRQRQHHQQQQPAQQWKARRCWSPELRRQFVVAIQQLGGAQGEDEDLAVRLLRNRALDSPC